MRFLVVHTRKVTIASAQASLQEKLQGLVADGTLKGRKPVARGFLWWASITPAGFRARYERLRFFVQISGQYSTGAHSHSTDIAIAVSIEVLSALALAMLCLGMMALVVAFPFPLIGLFALANIAFGLGLCRSACRHACDFVELQLVPALAEPPRDDARGPSPSGLGGSSSQPAQGGRL
jgi:hypothetical protein